MSIEVVRADSLGEPGRSAAAALLAHGFAQDFTAVTRDPERLAAAFEPIIVPVRFHLALRDGDPAGITTLTEPDQEVFDPRWAPLRRSLGVLRRTLLYLVVRGAFMGHDPDAAPGRAELGFVATAPEHRGAGVATALLRHLVQTSGHRVHVLRDIKDTNEAALHVYRRLGFVEYTRRTARFSHRAGFSAYVSMKRESPVS
ncbi:GNAT family N-acetyltransferase [Ruania zhangjianzhongii]|uniref:GNAT family N-acetyltransferase n=1 Tax=Ruania zhangjianzhongii TaxID=2603206 RepID=UPI0011CCD35D|nr:GNAT family N-acetyltransferase [Ruania zhangjianzhongii]